MKKFFTLIVAFLPLYSLIAQTFLAQEFGTRISDVHQFLDAKGVAYTFDESAAKITASTKAFTVTYYFEEGGLYKTETVTHFDQKKAASSQIELIRLQFSREKAEIVELDANAEIERFAVLKKRELHEVTAFSLSKNCTQIRNVAMDLDRMPGAAISDLRQDNLLFAMIR